MLFRSDRKKQRINLDITKVDSSAAIV